MPGYGQIGGDGSVFAKFVVTGKNPRRIINAWEAFDPLADREITFTFPRKVNLLRAVRGNKIKVKIPRNQRIVEIEWH